MTTITTKPRSENGKSILTPPPPIERGLLPKRNTRFSLGNVNVQGAAWWLTPHRFAPLPVFVSRPVSDVSRALCCDANHELTPGNFERHTKPPSPFQGETTMTDDDGRRRSYWLLARNQHLGERDSDCPDEWSCCCAGAFQCYGFVHRTLLCGVIDATTDDGRQELRRRTTESNKPIEIKVQVHSCAAW